MQKVDFFPFFAFETKGSEAISVLPKGERPDRIIIIKGENTKKT